MTPEINFAARNDATEISRPVSDATDVTDRAGADESLRRAEMELREAQRLAGVGSWQWDPATDTVSWSEELYRIKGLDPRTPVPGYKDHGQLYTEESWSRLQRAVENTLRTGVPYELELEIVRPDGTLRWITSRGEAQCDSSGCLVGLRGTAQDITERKHREDSLRLFRSLIDGSNDALEVLDPVTLGFLDVNHKACAELGYSREELLALSVRDIDPLVDETRLTTVVEQCALSGFALFESVHRRKDGSTFPVEVNIKPIVLDRRYCVAVVRDITDRKRAQEALRESEERLRLAAEAARIFAFTWDAATDEIVCSGTTALGFDPSAQTTGRQLLARVPKEDRERLRASIAQLTPDQPHLRVCHRMTRADGEVVWVERHSRAYFDANGKLARIVGMAMDITERKLAEEAVSRVNSRLIDAQEAERARMGRELHDNIGQRLALLALTLRQLTSLHAGDSSDVRHCMEALEKQTAELRADVQALSHELHSARLQHLGMVAAMKGFCADLAEQQNVDIDFGHAGVPRNVPPPISLCLYRVLQEALHNAVRHSKARRFDVHLRGTSGAVQLAVRDQGRGFDLEAAARGRGLGLTSMKERLKLVGGEFSIESQMKQGTTIFARVPLEATRERKRAN
jgi:PAS domain S-box-containing protein